jgi:hypothetical protein
MYAYAGGDPVNGSDPTGTETENRREPPRLPVDRDIRYVDKLPGRCSRLRGVNNCSGLAGAVDLGALLIALGGGGGPSKIDNGNIINSKPTPTGGSGAIGLIGGIGNVGFGSLGKIGNVSLGANFKFVIQNFPDFDDVMIGDDIIIIANGPGAKCSKIPGAGKAGCSVRGPAIPGGDKSEVSVFEVVPEFDQPVRVDGRFPAFDQTASCEVNMIDPMHAEVNCYLLDFSFI